MGALAKASALRRSAIDWVESGATPAVRSSERTRSTAWVTSDRGRNGLLTTETSEFARSWVLSDRFPPAFAPAGRADKPSTKLEARLRMFAAFA